MGDGAYKGYIWVVVENDRGGLRAATLSPELPTGPGTAGTGRGWGCRRPQEAASCASGSLQLSEIPGAPQKTASSLVDITVQPSSRKHLATRNWVGPIPKQATSQRFQGWEAQLLSLHQGQLVPVASAQDGPCLRVSVLCQLRTAVKTPLNKCHVVGFEECGFHNRFYGLSQ